MAARATYISLVASSFLDDHWPADWDDNDWDAALEDWTKEVNAALADRFLTWKNERDAQAAIAIVEAQK